MEFKSLYSNLEVIGLNKNILKKLGFDYFVLFYDKNHF